jgi:hypothetical protein
MPKTSSPETGVAIAVQSFTSLFRQAGYPLALDSYQRAFVWGLEKVEQLLADLGDYCDKARWPYPSLDYYMGTVLLHQDLANTRLFIIDGQQRLTCLSVLHHALTGSLPPNQELRFSSPQSRRNIQQTYLRFKDCRLQRHATDLFDHICFTVITVPSEDLAFTFFDTQNNRGLPLQATDLLKAYHLRAIGGQASISLQTDCAQRWERIQSKTQILGLGIDFAPTLFHQFLWRARCWTGQKAIARESHDDIIAEFQGGCLPSETPAIVPLYDCRSNRLAFALTLRPQAGYQLELQSRHRANDDLELPFAIRQPISSGVGFFLYASKYAALAQHLLFQEHPSVEVGRFRTFYHQVIATVSVYLQELFLLASVMYFDQFGDSQLLRFALWLDHVLGAIRLQKAYIFKEAPIKFLRDEAMNLLDVIANAFRPEDVIRYLQQHQWVNDEYDKESIEKRGGVQGRYKQAVLGYYRRAGSLRGKAGWIDALLAEGPR